MPRYSWPLGKTYLLGSNKSYQIRYHVTDLNILARANLHGSIEGAPKDQLKLAAHIFVVPKILGFRFFEQKGDKVDARCTTVVTKTGMSVLLEF